MKTYGLFDCNSLEGSLDDAMHALLGARHNLHMILSHLRCFTAPLSGRSRWRSCRSQLRRRRGARRREPENELFRADYSNND